MHAIDVTIRSMNTLEKFHLKNWMDFYGEKASFLFFIFLHKITEILPKINATVTPMNYTFTHINLISFKGQERKHNYVKRKHNAT